MKIEREEEKPSGSPLLFNSLSRHSVPQLAFFFLLLVTSSLLCPSIHFSAWPLPPQPSLSNSPFPLAAAEAILVEKGTTTHIVLRQVHCPLRLQEADSVVVDLPWSLQLFIGLG